MPIRQDHENLTVFVTPERVELARRTHRAVARTMFIVFGVLAAIILILGALLAPSGRTSLGGVIIVVAAFLAIPFAMAAWIRKIERDAERFLASDGSTQIVVGPTAVVIADTVVPYERITFMYANAEGEHYSTGGIRGEVMAARLDLTDDRPTVGRAIGAAVGTAQRRKLYRDGAKSGISLAIGIDGKSTIVAPDGMINRLKTLPHRGEDPGRIDVPFGAYLDISELEVLLGAVHRATGGNAFPVGIVSGTLNWASATTSAGETREKIWEGLATLIPAGKAVA